MPDPIGPRLPIDRESFSEAAQAAKASIRGKLETLDRKMTRSIERAKVDDRYIMMTRMLASIPSGSMKALQPFKAILENSSRNITALRAYLSLSQLLNALGTVLYKTHSTPNPDIREDCDHIKIHEKLNQLWSDMGKADNIVVANAQQAKDQLANALPGNFRAWREDGDASIKVLQKAPDGSLDFQVLRGTNSQIDSSVTKLIADRDAMRANHQSQLDELTTQKKYLGESQRSMAESELRDAEPGDYRLWLNTQTNTYELIFKRSDDTLSNKYFIQVFDDLHSTIDLYKALDEHMPSPPQK